ncbi:MAG: TetM/TetW/TetO/TetS family tetracycline resistance ribosomal protection protein [Provencibacterium sp.]|jgi:ribosomal protection tetracycline resistance protein|nr:TetM/TetW/TetO/TetS family tetracycline resistance ribosomal protection protein [Provencibacterium sp.]
MKRTIGVLAHVDAGKTTFCEQLLYQTGMLRRAGRVDYQTAYLDQSPIERERGITVFSDQAPFSYGGIDWFLVDTPGHADFSGEMERAIPVLDCAVLLLSCVEGIQSHTETAWGLLERYHIPTFLFLNKTDRAGADPQRVLRALCERFSSACLDFSDLQMGKMSEPLAEQLCELDDGLLERYLESGYEPALWLSVEQRLIRERKLFPVFCGAALQGEGILPFLDALCQLVKWETKEEALAPFVGRVYKIRHDSQQNRLSFLKVQKGTLRVKDEITTLSESSEPIREKVNELRSYSGAKFSPASEAGPGELVAVCGPRFTRPGDRVGDAPKRGELYTEPIFGARVLFEPSVSAQTVLGCFRILESEDPLLHVLWNEQLQQLHVRVLGSIQLEVLQQLCQERFGLFIRFGTCEVLYTETIAAPVTGCGHFEPLRHYAEVHLLLSPAARGSGIRFESACPLDLLSSNWQNLIRTHVLEKEHRGVLTGAPLNDVTVTLLCGRAHLKHTEGGDFREAVYRAIRQGLFQAQSILLEPCFRFQIEVELALTGKILSDLQRLHASFEPPQVQGKTALICGRGPAATLMDYPLTLGPLTKGRGHIRLQFDGYEPCHNTEEVIAHIGYEREHDTANTPDSVFCAHGAGFIVKWQDAPHYMHCRPEPLTPRK